MDQNEMDEKEFREFLDQPYDWDGIISTRREAWLSGEKGAARESWLASRRLLREKKNKTNG
jgi:hypothetical protein